MESNDNVKVCVRVRPTSRKEADTTSCVSAAENTVFLGAEDGSKQVRHSFTYDTVADITSTQEQIFDMVGKPVADYCLAGYNGTVFAYGQTGSGKTFTIQGQLTESGELVYEQRGLIPRVLEYLFSQMRERAKNRGWEFVVKCSYLEIYQETITDLLNTASGSLHIREDVKKGVYVEGLTEYDVADENAAYNYMQLGARNRHVGATAMNDQSSRSHSVFTLIVQSKETKEDGVVGMKYSRLHLIDLAGSERQKNTEATGKRLKEAGNINKSLLVLGNVIRALVEVANGKDRVFVQYRDSRLTHLLKDSLGGNAKTTIIATVSPADRNYGETLSTLKFANRAKMIKNNAVINEDSLGSVVSLQSENKKLREELREARSQLKRNGSSTDISVNSNSHSSEADSAALTAAICTSTNAMRVRQLETQWKKAWVKAYETKVEKEKMAQKVEELQKLCLKKDYFIQSMKMIIKLRDRKIAKLVGEVVETDSEKLKEALAEVKLLQWQVDNHPEVLRFAIENVEMRDLLDAYERLYGRENLEYEKMQQLVEEMSEQIQKVVEEKHKLMDIINNPGSRNGGLHGVGSPMRAQYEVQQWRHQQHIDRLQSEIDELKVQAMHHMRAHREKEVDLQASLDSAHQQLEDLEQQLKQVEAKRRLEIEQLYEQQCTAMEELRLSYTQELKDLQETHKVSEASQKNATLSILTLEKQLSQLAAEREKYLAELKQRDDEIRHLKKLLAQRELDQRRMSIALTGGVPDFQSRAGGVPDFNEDMLAERDKMLRNTVEQQLKKEFGKKIAAAVAKEQQVAQQSVDRAVEELKQRYELELAQLNNKFLEQEQRLEHAEVVSEELQFTQERLQEADQRAASYELTIAQLQQENRNMHATLEITQSALRSEHDQKVGQLFQQNHSLQDELKRLKEILEAKDWDLLQQQQEIVAGRRSAQSMADMVDGLRSSAVEAERKRHEMEAKLSELSATLRDRDEEISSLKSAEEQLDAIRSEREQLTDQVEDLISEAKLRQEEIKELSSRLASVEAARDEEAAMLRQELDNERQRADDSKAEADKIQQQQEEKISLLEASNAQLKTELNKLQKESNERESVVSSLMSENKMLSAQIADMRSEISKTHVASSGLSQELGALNEHIQSLQKANADQQAALSKLKSEAHEEISAKNIRIEQLQSEVAAAKSKISRLTDELQSSLKTATKLQREKDDMEGRFQTFEDEREKLFTDLANVAAERDQLASQFDRMHSELADAFQTQKQYLNDLRAARAAEETSRKECDIALRQLKHFETERDTAVREADAQKKLCESLNKQLDKLISHNNPNQKIQHHVKIKEENNQLKLQTQHLSVELRKKQEMVQRLQQKVEELNMKLTGKKEIAIDFDEEARLNLAVADLQKELLSVNKVHGDTLQQVHTICEAIGGLCTRFNAPAISGANSSVAEALQRLDQISEALQDKDAQIRNAEFALELFQKEKMVLEKVNSLQEGSKENNILRPANSM